MRRIELNAVLVGRGETSRGSAHKKTPPARTGEVWRGPRPEGPAGGAAAPLEPEVARIARAPLYYPLSVARSVQM